MTPEHEHKTWIQYIDSIQLGLCDHGYVDERIDWYLIVIIYNRQLDNTLNKTT